MDEMDEMDDTPIPALTLVPPPPTPEPQAEPDTEPEPPDVQHTSDEGRERAIPGVCDPAAGVYLLGHVTVVE